MSAILKENWLNEELKQEVVHLFQPSYQHTLTDIEITNIANSLADSAELWIKFNWRIDHVQQ